jgi:hypothetical protein
MAFQEAITSQVPSFQQIVMTVNGGRHPGCLGPNVLAWRPTIFLFCFFGPRYVSIVPAYKYEFGVADQEIGSYQQVYLSGERLL